MTTWDVIRRILVRRILDALGRLVMVALACVAATLILVGSVLVAMSFFRH